MSRNNVEILLVIDGKSAAAAELLGDRLCKELQGRILPDALAPAMPLAIVTSATVEAVAELKAAAA